MSSQEEHGYHVVAVTFKRLNSTDRLLLRDGRAWFVSGDKGVWQSKPQANHVSGEGRLVEQQCSISYPAEGVLGRQCVVVLIRWQYLRLWHCGVIVCRCKTVHATQSKVNGDTLFGTAMRHRTSDGANLAVLLSQLKGAEGVAANDGVYEHDRAALAGWTEAAVANHHGIPVVGLVV